jgi:hypothetical protein
MFSHSQWLAISLLFAGLSGNLLAVDGVVLIDQNRALAGGVTPGDALGFPITISVPGTYRLSGNLSVPPLTSAIELTVSNITLDLNGFSITTPTNPIGATNSMGQIVFGIGYTGPGIGSGFTIRNGVVEGFVSPILFFGTPNSVLDSLLLHWGGPGNNSFLVGAFSLVRNVSARDQNLEILCPSVVTATAFRTIFTGDTTCALNGNASLIPPSIFP